MPNRIFLAVCGFVFLIILVVVLLIDGPQGDTSVLVLNIVTPLMIACFAGAGFVSITEKNHTENKEKLDTIEHQTNGILDAKIRKAIGEAFVGQQNEDEYGPLQ